MCGRFALYNKEKVFKKFNVEIDPNFNINPGNNIDIFFSDFRHLSMKWGYSPNWAKNNFSVHNARIESLHEKKFFSNTLRCVVIADGYFEWKIENKKKIPYYFFLRNNLIFFAGLCNLRTGCCILTKTANGKHSIIHHRQPLILSEDEVENWLINNKLNFKLDKYLEFYEISKSVNFSRNNNNKIIQRLP